jgi:hypothetical protein
MKLKLKSDETFFAGDVPVVVPAGTEVDFSGADNFDQLAGELAVKPALYAQFRDDLAHEETVTRHIDGEDVEVTIVVEYGVGGQRNEGSVEDFQKRQAEKVRGAEITAANEAAQAAQAAQAETPSNDPPVNPALIEQLKAAHEAEQLRHAEMEMGAEPPAAEEPTA